MTEEYDIIIKEAKIVDGVNKSYIGSIGVKGERIATVGDFRGDAKHFIDARGLIAMPGFVDSHSHADGSFPYYPDCKSALFQGCTTVIAGQCGGSPAPVADKMRPPRIFSDEMFEKNPYIYRPESSQLPLDEVNAMLRERLGWEITWKTMGEYFEFLRDLGISINYAPLVGHGTIRRVVLGEDYKRTSTPEELEKMKGYIHVAMKEGCIGMSVGLDYDPSVFASKDEINQCVSVLKEYDGIYAPHWRRTGRRRNIGMGTRLAEPIDGIIEVVDTCKDTGVRMNIAHIAPGWHTIPPMTPEIGVSIGEATLKPINEAVKEGHKIAFDCIPWQCWEPLPYLSSAHFPQWLRLLGDREKVAKWLKLAEFRKKAWEEIEAGKIFQRVVINPCLNPHWAENLMITKHDNEEYDGVLLSEAAKKMEKDPWETLCDLIVEDPHSRGSHTDYRGIEEQMKTFFKHPLCCVGLDVGLQREKWERKVPPYGTPLPDTYSGYPKFITRYNRDSNFLTLEEVAYKCATLPASFHMLEDRGTLTVGSYADITLFDLANLKIVGHPAESNLFPEGIPYVIVNGTITVNGTGNHSGARAGSILVRRN
jgi:N-acyl-D-amino-acid deacylase